MSGNSKFYGIKMKDLIDEFVSKTNFDQISSIGEIKDALNRRFSKSTKSITVDKFVEDTFEEFEKNIKKLINEMK